jgi:hypothetical protein
VLDYADFGPQSLAYKTTGMEWWQWDDHGHPDPAYEYDVKVVVYRDIPLIQVQESYPVLEAKEQDYRYLTYAKAMAYLDEQIQENIVLEVTQRLKQTKLMIERKMGKSNKAIGSD